MTTHAYQVGPWTLEDLYPSREAWEAAMRRVEEEVERLETWRERLREDIPEEDFRRFLEQMEALSREAHKVGSYAYLKFAADTQDREAQAMLARVRQWSAEIQNRLLFFELWWKNLPDAAAQRLLKVAGDMRYYLEKLRLFRPYTLSEAEERIINYKDAAGIRTLVSLYNTMTSRYTFPLEVDGEVKELTRAELSTYFRHPDPDLREQAYRSLFQVYTRDTGLIAPIYQAVTQDWYNEQVRVRGFPRPISARNLTNHLPDEVVDTLLSVCRENATVFQRFFRVKARALGMDRLRRYDVYAPVGQADRTYDFATAVDMILEAFRRFHPQLADLARRVFDEGHLDSETRPGKRGGAFCASVVPGLTPWVLMSYQGKINDVATLAHELGHAIHGMLAGHHSVYTFHAPLPLAETASTFGEMLLVEYLLERETDPEVRKAILFHQLDDNYATVMRQAYFALFEVQAHDRFPQGASADQVAEGYLELLKEQFGDAVTVSDEFAWEWLAIPHFYQVPFYVYAYAFGQLLVLALYRRYQEEGEAFKPKYLDLLAAGGSRAPMDLLADLGIDPGDPAFWQGGFDVLNAWVDQVAGLID